MKKLNNRVTQDKNFVSQNANPWAGLASYEDPENSNSHLEFYGREDESYDLAKLISKNIIVTLYGRSGVGKTSLINAGVFPELRIDNFLPISIRLGMIQNGSNTLSLQSKIIESIKNRVYSIKEINVIDVQLDHQAPDFLWNYFARHRFFNEEGAEITPVLVFDQFEELFNFDSKDADTLLRQLDYINDRDHHIFDDFEIDGVIYRYETNYRFVLSIREDDLYKLEDSIDDCFLPALKRCRYRLHGLSNKGAKDVILKPCEKTSVFETGQENPIAERIIDICGGHDKNINTLMLSLLCHVLYNDCIEQNKTIKVSDLDNYENIIQVYYLSLVNLIPQKQRKYLEDNLVDEQGRRKTIYLSDLRKNAPDAEFLTQSSNTRLLSVNTDRVELVHDQLAAIIQSFRNQRIEDQRNKSIAVSLSTYYIIAVYFIWHILLTILHASWAYNNHRNSTDYILEIVKEISIDDFSIDFVQCIIGLQIYSNILLIYLLGYELPKKVCEYFYSALNIKRLCGVIGGIIISAVLGTKWVVGQSIYYHSLAIPIIGWIALYLILLISKPKKSK